MFVCVCACSIIPLVQGPGIASALPVCIVPIFSEYVASLVSHPSFAPPPNRAFALPRRPKVHRGGQCPAGLQGVGAASAGRSADGAPYEPLLRILARRARRRRRGFRAGVLKARPCNAKNSGKGVVFLLPFFFLFFVFVYNQQNKWVAFGCPLKPPNEW